MIYTIRFTTLWRVEFRFRDSKVLNKLCNKSQYGIINSIDSSSLVRMETCPNGDG
jgi:hypothetical protein